MEAITLLIAVVALIIAILAYVRTGGMRDQIQQFNSLTSTDLKKQIDLLREKTADALDRLEKVVRKTEKGE
jgi:chemotaxis regulatin CheY-phosphate phosphatase CheZ